MHLFFHPQVQSGPLKSLCVPTVWNQAGSSPPLELEKLAVQSLPGMSSTKKKMDPRPSTTHSSGPTWGDIKKLTYHAEQTLKFTGAPFSPENLFLPMIEQITSNSKATKVKRSLILLSLLVHLLQVSGMVY